MSTKMSGRFTTVTRLTSETKVLGATAKQWDEALTGDMANSLKIVKEKVEAMRKAEAIAQIDEQKILLADEVNKTE